VGLPARSKAAWARVDWLMCDYFYHAGPGKVFKLGKLVEEPVIKALGSGIGDEIPILLLETNGKDIQEEQGKSTHQCPIG
jgi:hypothetical protein